MFYLLSANRKVIVRPFVTLNRALREVNADHSASSMKELHFAIVSKGKNMNNKGWYSSPPIISMLSLH